MYIHAMKSAEGPHRLKHMLRDVRVQWFLVNIARYIIRSNLLSLRVVQKTACFENTA